ncbi:MAG: hypothetical protein CME62_06170 [Halobacteriovoraceae bacterium]|nr:hypothetical protein [Halobacteriovoraceae bacterium]|tara:strand:- start:14481 stop:15257 length:777 start_codon:yes stop_codon:yes gene_type:complete
MNQNILNFQNQLVSHPVYNQLNSLENIQTFMKYHVFAVWDFMSLLKSLQKEITCVELPWLDSRYSAETVRLINEIVLSEESDVDEQGVATSHFALYLRAMKEVGADTSLIETFLETQDYSMLPEELAEVVQFHIDLAQRGKVHEVAASFFYGREKLIPDMFISIVQTIILSGVTCPAFTHYLNRHIELDGGDHGPKAEACLNQLLKTDKDKSESEAIAMKSLEMRDKLWNFILSEITISRPKNSESLHSEQLLEYQTE